MVLRLVPLFYEPPTYESVGSHAAGFVLDFRGEITETNRHNVLDFQDLLGSHAICWWIGSDSEDALVLSSWYIEVYPPVKNRVSAPAIAGSGVYHFGDCRHAECHLAGRQLRLRGPLRTR